MAAIRRESFVAFISLLASLLGVLVGGFVSYVVEHELSSEQRQADRARTNEEREAVARGAARVLRSQLKNAEWRAEKMVERKRLYRWTGVRVGLSQSDQQLIAVRLSPDQWEKVATAMADIALYAASRANERPGVRATVKLDEQQLRYLRQTRDSAHDGIQALSSLTDK